MFCSILKTAKITITAKITVKKLLFWVPWEFVNFNIFLHFSYIFVFTVIRFSDMSQEQKYGLILSQISSPNLSGKNFLQDMKFESQLL